MGPNIYDLLINSNFNYIYPKISNDVENILKEKNKSLEFNIALQNNYIYVTNQNDIQFIPIINKILVIANDGTKIYLDLEEDKQIIQFIFARLNKNFDYKKL